MGEEQIKMLIDKLDDDQYFSSLKSEMAEKEKAISSADISASKVDVVKEISASPIAVSEIAADSEQKVQVVSEEKAAITVESVSVKTEEVSATKRRRES